MTDDELIAALADARAKQIYEDDPEWEPIDAALQARGHDLSDRV